jgi:hypothetical protein
MKNKKEEEIINNHTIVSNTYTRTYVRGFILLES